MNVGKLILHYNTPKLTESLCNEVSDAIVIDNGSPQPYTGKNRVIKFNVNYGFTKGWNEAIKALWNEFDAFWLMNSDITISKQSVKRICKLMEGPDIGMITPSYNCWMKNCQKLRPDGIREVMIMEFTAPVIKKSVFEKIGLFDETFVRGYGVEFDFCYKMRQAGLKMFVDDGSSFYHIGHQTIKNNFGIIPYSQKANLELNQGLSKKYGTQWRNVILKGIEIKSDFNMNIAIYTTIFGDYDTHKPWPFQYIKADYFIVTDNPGIKCPGWKTIVVNHPRKDLHPRLRAKFFKIFPWEVAEIASHELSIYIDASIQVTSDEFIDYCIRNLASDMVLFKHPNRNCIYDEIEASIKLIKYQSESLREQAKFYKKFHPAHAGLYACGVLVRKHTDTVRKVMHDWWFENLKFTYQDQISFPVVCRANGFQPSVFEENQYKSGYFEVKWHDDKKKPDISVLMPVHNTPPDLMQKAVDSILNQSFKNFELIIINDSSTDKHLVNYLKELHARDKRISICKTRSNKGLAHALDLGISKVNSGLIVRMDSDDIAFSNLLQKHFDWFNTHPDANICGVQIRYNNGVVRTTNHKPVVNRQSAYNNRYFWITNHPGIGYRTSFIKSMGGYGDIPAYLAEDYPLWCKILNAGHLIYNMPDVLIDYRMVLKSNRTTEKWLSHLENCRKSLK